MILLNRTEQLQQNNLYFREELYFQPVVIPHDIAFQGFLPKQLQNDYSYEIHLMSYEGDEFIANITDDFDALFAVSIYNQNYFNFRLKKFAPIFDEVEFFTLKLIVKNAGFIVFSKITETYRKLKTSKSCYVVIDDFAMMIINKAGFIKVNNLTFQFGQGLQNYGLKMDYIDGNYHLYVNCDDVVKIGYCYQGEDVLIDVPLMATEFVRQDGCNLPLIRIEGSYNCQDNITGGYFGDPKILLNYPKNNKFLRHTNSSYIYAELETLPTEIKKESTFLGKPQKVEYIQKLQLTGLELFPKWRMLEIESIFASRRLFIDGVEYIYRGGKIFSKSEISGSCSFKLRADLEKLPKINDFSCLDDCSTNCCYFVIPAGEKDQTYYDETKTPIAYTYEAFLDYFRNLADVISVEDFNIEPLDCEPLAVVKIDSFGIVPDFIYYKLPSNEFKVFAKYDVCDKPTTLCQGISGCFPPKNISSVISAYIPCPEVPQGITSFTTDLGQAEDINYELINGWSAENISIKKLVNTSEIKVEFTLSNPAYENTEIIGARVMKLSQYPSQDITFNTDTAQVSFLDDGYVEVDGNLSNGKIILTSKTFKI